MPHTPVIHSACQHDWENILRNKGLRVTAQRIAVLNYVHGHAHADAENIFQNVKVSLAGISLQAVHQIVQDLSEKGLLRRISLPDSASARYETRIEDNHHHVQCIRCGHIADVDCVTGHAPCLDPSHAHGMRIIEATVVFRGICRDCESLS